MNRWLLHGAIIGFVGVAMGAFGAHALKKHFLEAPDLGAIYQTGSEYALVHAVVLLVVGVLSQKNPSKVISVAGWAFTFGCIVFSGTLWLLAIFDIRWLGAITPIGGLSLLVGWVGLMLAARSSKTTL